MTRTETFDVYALSIVLYSLLSLGLIVSLVELKSQNGVESIAFCCISTGVFHFPNQRAAEIAVETVGQFKAETGSEMKVIFNVFKDLDLEIYRRLLTENRAAKS